VQKILPKGRQKEMKGEIFSRINRHFFKEKRAFLQFEENSIYSHYLVSILESK
jgi:hypothetical protein